VLVVNYRAGPLLAQCLRCLARQTVENFEAIVVDNGSSDGSLAAARLEVDGDQRFIFIEPGSNLGFAAGNNLGAARAGAPWLATLNPDAFADSDWLEQLLAATARHPDIAMFGSTQIDAADPERLDGCGDHYFFAGLPWRGGYGWPVAALPPEGPAFSPCAAAALYRRDAFRAVGGFDERFFCYVEDVDLAFRLRLLGHRAIQVPAARVRHVGGASSGGASSDFACFQGARNMVWCFVKNMPGPLFGPLLPIHLAAMVLYCLIAALRGQGRAATGGVLAALTALPWAQRRHLQAARRIPWLAIARAMAWSPFARGFRSPMASR
jgi:GT2 family glycosyltransferase